MAVVVPSKPRLLQILGPGLVTGASDDDPSGIATYSQAGAAFGYAMCWTLLVSYPLMVAIQVVCAQVGRVTGRGIAGNIARVYPRPVIAALVAPLFVANVINIGANLGAMADCVTLLAPWGRPVRLFCVLGFGAGTILAQIFLPYDRYVRVLKWMALVLLAYVGALMFAHVDWSAVAHGLLPQPEWTVRYIGMVVAIFGTTISPYLFFWQASQEAEDLKAQPSAEPLLKQPSQAAEARRRIRLDTIVGMGISNIVALAIVVTAAATLHKAGVVDVKTSVDAARALVPIAGRLASLLFALGIIGTGLLAIPVLAGSAAYAIAEARRWPHGLARKPKEAKAFYGVIGAAIVVGMLLNILDVSPLRALVWSAVINGVVAVPVAAMVLRVASNSAVMHQFVISRRLRVAGWATTAVMAALVVTMATMAIL